MSQAESKRPESDLSEPRRLHAHETKDVNFAGVIVFAAGLILLFIVCLLLSWWMFTFLMKSPTAPRAPSVLDTPSGRLPPQPRLEGLENLSNQKPPATQPPAPYSWVDRPTGVIRIPVRSAMKILANHLPAKETKTDNSGDPRGEHQ